MCAPASVILLMMMFIFTLLGMQLFGGKFQAAQFEAGDEPDHNFDTFWWAMVTVFQVLTGENWNAVMYDGMRGGGQTIGLIYFLSLVIIGTFIRHSLTLRHPNTPLQLRASPLHLVLIPASTPPLRTFQACLL